MKKYLIDNVCMDDFLAMYCEGKTFLWNAFFGWRKTVYSKNGQKWLRSYYIVPERIYQMAKRSAEVWDDYKVLGGN